MLQLSFRGINEDRDPYVFPAMLYSMSLRVLALEMLLVPCALCLLVDLERLPASSVTRGGLVDSHRSFRGAGPVNLKSKSKRSMASRRSRHVRDRARHAAAARAVEWRCSNYRSAGNSFAFQYVINEDRDPYVFPVRLHSQLPGRHLTPMPEILNALQYVVLECLLLDYGGRAVA